MTPDQAIDLLRNPEELEEQGTDPNILANLAADELADLRAENEELKALLRAEIEERLDAP